MRLIRKLALLTVIAGSAVLVGHKPAEADEYCSNCKKMHYCWADTNNDGTAEMWCWGYGGCEVSSSGCRAW